jgi:hypothetical protein
MENLKLRRVWGIPIIKEGRGDSNPSLKKTSKSKIYRGY